MMKNPVPAFFCAVLVLWGAPLATASPALYSTLPGALPPNLPSVGYEATSTAELGDLIQLAPSGDTLSRATVLMSDWALASTYSSTDPGWYHDITLNLYSVDASSGTPQPGALIRSVTQNVFIPWRPEASPGCGTAWRAADGNCYNGLAFTIQFDLDGVRVPSQMIYGVAFNTANRGYHPIGANGPYNSLNFAVSSVPPVVGTNPLPGTVYTSGGGAFQQSTGFGPYSGAIEFDAGVPEPGTITLLAAASLFILASIRRRESGRNSQ